MALIGIVGAGNVGSALAERLTEAGHQVRIANSRGPQTLRDVEAQTGAKAFHVGEAVAGADFVVVAVPFGQVPRLRAALDGGLAPGAVVIDTTNYIPERDGEIAGVDRGLPETAWVSRQLGVPAVKVFNNLTSDSLARGGRPRGDRHRIALPVSGDDPSARAAVMGLVDGLGFDAYDAGPLADSWRQQPGQPAYCPDPTLAELGPLLDRADRAKAPANRATAMKLMAKLPADFPAQDLVRVSRLSVGLDTLRPRSWLAVARVGLAALGFGR